MENKVSASMLLGAVGDALGYKNGQWEFCQSGNQIQRDVTALGSLENIVVQPPEFIVSDDTVMCIATAEALVSDYKDEKELFTTLAKAYRDCMNDMEERAPGMQTLESVARFKDGENGWFIPFSPKGGGCGGAMRATPIGLFYHKKEYLKELISVSVESGRMTHNNPVGYLGAFAAALFTSFAMQGIQLELWGSKLMECEPDVWKYIETCGRDIEKNQAAWPYFWDKWRSYLTDRGLLNKSAGVPTFVQRTNETVEERDQFYKSLSFSGWGGSSGHDAPMIAYDALLHAKNNWKELCNRAMFHGGDSDSTGILACSWYGALYGALYGMQGVPEANHKKIEYHDRILKLSNALAKKSMTLK